MSHPLEFHAVSAGYGQVEVLHAVDLVVPQGTLVSLVGPNGAGKTTLLRVAAGLVPPTGGAVHVTGRPINGRQPFEVARRGLCLIPEGRGIFPALTVRENLMMQAEGGDRSEEALERVFDYFPRLRERVGQRAGTMSGGEQQMLAMSRALITDPEILLLDEISMGLAPIIVSQLMETVAALSEAGVTILMVEQYLTYALQLSEVIYVLQKGEVAFVGEPGELRHSDAASHLTYGAA